jgi:hypothetical protein
VTVELRLSDMLRSLIEAEIEFLVFGMVAASFHGYVRATHDLDIVLRPSPDNVERMVGWLTSCDARLASNPEHPLATTHLRRLRMGHNAWVTTPFGELDIVQHIDGLPGWDELAGRAREVDAGAMSLRIVDLETLISRKRARASSQDLADVEALEAIRHAS